MTDRGAERRLQSLYLSQTLVSGNASQCFLVDQLDCQSGVDHQTLRLDGQDCAQECVHFQAEGQLLVGQLCLKNQASLLNLVGWMECLSKFQRDCRRCPAGQVGYRP